MAGSSVDADVDKVEAAPAAASATRGLRAAFPAALMGVVGGTGVLVALLELGHWELELRS